VAGGKDDSLAYSSGVLAIFKFSYLLSGREKAVSNDLTSRHLWFWAGERSPLKWQKSLRVGLFLSKRRLLRREKHPPRNDRPVYGRYSDLAAIHSFYAGDAENFLTN
jgi:hypothetical protein